MSKLLTDSVYYNYYNSYFIYCFVSFLDPRKSSHLSVPGRVLWARADQLASVFTDIFNLSLFESVITTCFKQTTIVPVPKNTKVTCLNDYRPVALMTVAIKCFQRLVMAHIIPETLDPLQFAHNRPNRSTDDAISFALPSNLSQQDKNNTYVRNPFIDYISAFNTIVLSKLIPGTKHIPLQLDPGLPDRPPPGGTGR